MNVYTNLKNMLENIRNENNETTVWRGADGSYAVGETFTLEMEDNADDCEYIEDGKIKDYA